jgi:chemotaxis protein CheD
MSTKQASQQAIPQESIYLMVGDLYFGNQAKEVKTLLGSCVAITLWHPKLKVGGMSHIALPESRNEANSSMNTRFADGAINSFISYMTDIDTQPKEYIVHLYGGGQMFHKDDKESYNDVGAKNLANTRRLLKLYRFNIVKEDVSGSFYRHVCLNLQNGHVELRKTPVSDTMG